MTWLRGASILLPERAMMFEKLTSCGSSVRAAGEDRPERLAFGFSRRRGPCPVRLALGLIPAPVMGRR